MPSLKRILFKLLLTEIRIISLENFEKYGFWQIDNLKMPKSRLFQSLLERFE